MLGIAGPLAPRELGAEQQLTQEQVLEKLRKLPVASTHC